MDKIAARVRDLHQGAIIIDGHSDILIPVTEGKMALSWRRHPSRTSAPYALAVISCP